MTLASGTRLGPYEILAPLGAGGMGEVYRARDTKLKRDVALKVLPEAFSRDPERMARFQREAEVLASLNHPNIAQIYGVTESGDDRALVMELVEGGSPKGPMPFDEAWKIASQIAAALEYAHDKGIIHRDLKPANIKVTPEGVVKLLDFGLAKAFTTQREPTGNVELSPTLTIGMTEAGMILGTAAYMPPEQARGKSVDKRADIWAFGVVLYEMLTGERLFEGETVSDTLIEVATKEPDWDRVPAKVRRLLRRCLAKDPKKRLRDIGDVELLLEDAQPEPVPVQAAPPLNPWWRSAGWMAAAAVSSIALVALAFIHFREKQPVAEAARFEIGPPPKARLTCCLSISPDGRKIAFTAQQASDTRPSLWVRALDTLEAKTVYLGLVGTTAPHPFWSPDSRFIAFNSDGKIRKVEASGGPAQTICDAPPGFTGGAWSPDDVIIAGGTGGLLRVSAAGGDPSPLTTLDPSRQETAHLGPALLPDGRHFLYLRSSNRDQSNGIYVGSLDAKPDQQDARRLLVTSVPAAYAASQDASAGHILFLRESTLMAQPFDNGKLALAGDAVPVAESVATSGGRGSFAVSATGTLIYRSGASARQELRLTWFDRQGKVLGQLGDPADYSGSLALSPDGTRVASERGPNAKKDIWLSDSRGVSSRFTFDPADDFSPVWSPDGSRIAFASNRTGHYDLYQKPANGAGEDELLLKSDEDKRPTDWSPDHRSLIFNGLNPKTRFDLWVLPDSVGAAGGPSQPVPWLRTQFNESDATFSPDSHWIAYNSNESGRPEIYVRPFTPPGSAASAAGNPPAAGKWQVSKDGAAPNRRVRWRSDAKELFFLGFAREVMAVDVTVTPVFRSETPRLLFQLPPNTVGWDATGEGKRFLAALPGGAGPVSSDPPESMSVVLNWTEGLKK